MIRLGTAFKCTEPPYHRCVVISDPEYNGGQVLLVRLTSDDGTWPDRDCLLAPVDWSELDRPSTVAYSTCKYGPAVAALEQALNRGLFMPISSPARDVLRKMISAGRQSAGMSPEAKKWLAHV